MSASALNPATRVPLAARASPSILSALKRPPGRPMGPKKKVMLAGIRG
jgi:hypothetical protein